MLLGAACVGVCGTGRVYLIVCLIARACAYNQACTSTARSHQHAATSMCLVRPSRPWHTATSICLVRPSRPWHTATTVRVRCTPAGPLLPRAAGHRWDCHGQPLTAAIAMGSLSLLRLPGAACPRCSYSSTGSLLSYLTGCTSFRHNTPYVPAQLRAHDICFTCAPASFKPPHLIAQSEPAYPRPAIIIGVYPHAQIQQPLCCCKPTHSCAACCKPTHSCAAQTHTLMCCLLETHTLMRCLLQTRTMI